MPMTRALGGVSLTTGRQTVVTNTAADNMVRTYVLDFVNIDGVNAADISFCSWMDISAQVSGRPAERPLMPINATVRPGRDGALSRRVVLDPGDSIESAASAGGDIYVTVTQVFEEPAA